MSVEATGEEPIDRTGRSHSDGESIPAWKRLRLLVTAPIFTAFPTHVLERIAANMREERFPAGAAVISEGDLGDRVFLVVEGRAEASTVGREGRITLAAFSPGEIFGEVALVIPSQTRSATVTAATPLVLLSLSAVAFNEALDAQPETRESVSEAARTILTVNFLKRASPFAPLDVDALQILAGRVRHVRVPSGADVIRQGERGDSCYLLYQGSAIVLVNAGEESERRIDVVRSGDLIGETALLTNAPRNATIRAVEDCDLLALNRADLLNVMSDARVSEEMLHLVRERSRPKQAAGIEVRQRSTVDDSTITLLHDRHRGSFYRLSPEGWFLWQRLDGQHTVRDLCVACQAELKHCDVATVHDLIAGLERAGFLETSKLRSDVAKTTHPRPWWWRLIQR